MACNVPPQLLNHAEVKIGNVKKNQDLLSVINEYDAALMQCQQDKHSAVESIRISNKFLGQ